VRCQLLVLAALSVGKKLPFFAWGLWDPIVDLVEVVVKVKR
jgi:hypothetical protein